MVDWLAVWEVANAVGFIFKPILEELTKDAAKDFVKDFFKDSLKHVLLREKDPRTVASGKAIKEFLQLVQQELKFRRLPEAEIKQYTKALKQFIDNKSVKEILGKAFDSDCDSLDATTLEGTWNSLQLPPLPPKFNWQAITDQYLRKVQEILWESEDLRAILDSQNLESIEKTNKEIAGLIPDFNLSRYREGIQEQYGNLKLESLDTSGYAYNELKLWRMFVAQNVREVHQILPQIHEIPKEHQKRLRESNQLEAEISTEELERYKEIYDQQPTRSVLEIVEDRVGAYGVVGEQGRVPLHTVILGDPGAGKSTLLQYIALNWAEQPLKDLSLQPIPLLIELRTYIRNWDLQQCKDFLEFFHQGSGIVCRLNQHQLHERLKVGNAIVMFDGLDEVFDLGKREDVIRDIIRFTNDYPKLRVIVTSRVIGYKVQELRNAKFRHFMLQDLESEQIKDFINRWHDLTFNNEADKVRKRDRLQIAIDTSSSIRELAGNPLLLTMMAILNRNQELPRDRSELYNQASRVLLYQWDIERALVEDTRLDPKTIDYKDKQAMLRQVAYYMQTNEKGLAGNLISASALEKILTDYLKTIEVSDARAVAKLMINQLRTRNFILCFMGANYYAFVHRTFLEYFCAWEFVWQFKETQTLSLEKLKNEVFGKHWQDESWHEVLRLIAGMIEPKFTGEIIDYLIEIEDEINNEGGDDDECINLLFLASECLSEVRNRSIIASTDNKLLKYLKSLTAYYAPYSLENFVSADQANLIHKTRTQAVSVISTTWRSHSETLPWLKTIARSGFDWDDGSTQATAVRELARGWKNEPETLPMLKTLANSNDDRDNSSVQFAAIQELAHGWKDDPETLPMLKSLAKSSENKDLKIIAIQELARDWKDDSNILSVLKTCVQLDNDGYIKYYLMQELIQGWQVSPDIYDFLYKCAIDDTFNVVIWNFSGDTNIFCRQTALEAIIEQYPEHPQTLPLLRDRADNDPDKRVQKFAKEKLREWELERH